MKKLILWYLIFMATMSTQILMAKEKVSKVPQNFKVGQEFTLNQRDADTLNASNYLAGVLISYCLGGKKDKIDKELCQRAKEGIDMMNKYSIFSKQGK